MGLKVQVAQMQGLQPMLGKRPGQGARRWAVQSRMQTYQDVMDSEVQNGCKVCSHVQGLQGMLGGSQARATAKQWAVPSRVPTYQADMGSEMQINQMQGLQPMLGKRPGQARATAKQWAVPSRMLTYQTVMASKVQNETNVQGVQAMLGSSHANAWANA